MSAKNQYYRQYVPVSRLVICLTGILCLMRGGYVQAQDPKNDLSDMLEHELLDLSIPKLSVSKEATISDRQAA